MNKNIIGLGILGLTAYAIFKPTKEQEEVSTKSNPSERHPGDDAISTHHKQKLHALFGDTDYVKALLFHKHGLLPKHFTDEQKEQVLTSASWLKKIANKNPAKKKTNPMSKRWKHSVPDKDMPMVLASLAYLKTNPEMFENIPDKTLNHLVNEKWFDVENAELTDLGNEFLENITAESED